MKENPTDTTAYEGSENDQDNLKSHDDDSPGVAAKKARLRSAMKKVTKRTGADCRSPNCVQPDGSIPKAAADETRVTPSGESGGSIGVVARDMGSKLKKMASMLNPAQAQAQMATLPPTVVSPPREDPMASIKSTARGFEKSGDTTSMRRFLSKLKSMEK